MSTIGLLFFFFFSNYSIAVYMKEPFYPPPLATCSTKNFSHRVQNVDKKGKSQSTKLAKSNERRRSIRPKHEGVRVILGQVGSGAHLVKTTYIPKLQAQWNQVPCRVKSGAGDVFEIFCVDSMRPPCWQCVHQVPMCSPNLFPMPPHFVLYPLVKILSL